MKPRLTLTLAAALLAGCASWSTETKVEEATYQALGIVDAAVSVQAFRHPDCYTETNPTLGPHPSAAASIGYAAARGTVHFAITSELEDLGAPPLLKRVWQGLGFYYEGRAIRLGWSNGARPWGARCHEPGPPEATNTRPWG